MVAPLRLKLARSWPGLARAAWFVIAGLSLSLLALAAPIVVRTIYGDWQFGLTYPVVAGFASRAAYAAYLMGLNYAVALVCIGVAALIAWRRAAEPMAWLAAVVLVVAPVMFSLGGYVESWRYYPAPWRHILPVVRAGLVWPVGVSSLLAFVFVFPNGRFGARWIAVLAGGAVALAIVTTGWVAVGGDRAWDYWFASFMLALVAGAGVQLYRFRRLSSAVERQQTKWVVAGIAGLVATLLAVSVLSVATENGAYAGVAALASHHLQLAMLTCLPLSLAFSIFRYRLWDIDLLLNRALVYGALTVCVIAVYVLVVGVAGVALQNFNNPALAVVAIGVLALAVQPLRRRLQSAVNRLMYGERHDPATALSRLGQRLEAALAPGRELATIVETVAQAIRVPYAAIEIKEGDEYGSAAAAGTYQDKAELIPLVYQSQTIGRLVVGWRAPGEPFSAADRRLLNDLARQAAPAVHAYRLATDLQHSRERIVIAREEERRRLRRDLHDGFGPILASQTLKLDAALDLLASDPAAAGRLLAEVKAQTQGAVADIRRLVYELRPPALDELGLVGALQAHLQTLPGNGLRVTFEAPLLPPLSAAVEVAAYRIALEAVTNTVRHARASECRLRLTAAPGALEIDIEDNGAGLPDGRSAGIGLASMRERAAELGGVCGIEAGPTGGVRVSARLPLAPSDHG